MPSYFPSHQLAAWNAGMTQFAAENMAYDLLVIVLREVLRIPVEQVTLWVQPEYDEWADEDEDDEVG